MSSTKPTRNQVFLFVPNLIGYARIAFTLLSYFTPFPNLFLILYSLSFVLDAIDGIVARRLNQCSRLGALLDMVTDRLSTMGLVMLLAARMPLFMPLWIGANILDFVSHWSRMYSSFMLGESSHKFTPKNQHWLLTLYYDMDRRWFMMLCCIGNELFYIWLYYCGFASKQYLWESVLVNLVFWGFITPFWIMKQILNAMQLHLSWTSVVDQELSVWKAPTKRSN